MERGIFIESDSGERMDGSWDQMRMVGVGIDEDASHLLHTS